MFIAVCATAPKVLWLNAFSPTVADQVNECMTIDGTIAHVHQRSAGACNKEDLIKYIVRPCGD